MPGTGNDNWQLGKDLPPSVVDDLADKLAIEFNNPQFRKWYCQKIYELGMDKIAQLRAKVHEADEPGKLFSHYARQESRALYNKWRLKHLKDDFDGK